jgi:hypothetical protein
MKTHALIIKIGAKKPKNIRNCESAVIDIGVIEQEDAGGRSTSYRLKRIVEGEAEKQLEAGGE